MDGSNKVALSFRRISPPADLGLVVRDVWLLRGRPEAAAPVEPILPDGCPELVVNRADPFVRTMGETGWEEQPRGLLVGPQTRPAWVRPTGAVDLVGLRLQPWGLGLLVGPVAAELRDSLPAIDDVVPTLARDLGDAADGRVDDELVGRLFQCLRARLAANRPQRVSAIRRLALAAHWVAERGASMETAASAVGLGRRQMERLFRREVGLASGTLRRIYRFQRAVGAKSRHPTLTWSRIAVAAGYADQSHLTRDFRAFAGLPPVGHTPPIGSLTTFFLDLPKA